MTTPSRAPLSASGSLEELQASLLAHGARDFAGSFDVRTHGLVGEIKIANGCLVSSTLGAAQDESALTRILLADAGSFSTQAQTISAANGAPQIAAALSAASREAKVLTEASSTVGGLARIWSVRFRALDQVLKEIPKEVSPLLRLLDGTRTINDLFVESSLPPRVTVRVLSRLLSMGVLVLPDDALAGDDDAISIEESGKNAPAPKPVAPKAVLATPRAIDDVEKALPAPKPAAPKVAASKVAAAPKVAASKAPIVDDVAKTPPPVPKVAASNADVAKTPVVADDAKTPVDDVAKKTPVVVDVAKTVATEKLEEPKKPVVAVAAKKSAEKPAEAKPAEAKPVEAKPVEAKPAEEKSAEEKPAETKKNDEKETEGPRPLPEPDAREQTPTQESIAVNRWSSPKEAPKKVPAMPPAMPTQEALLEAAASIPSASDVASIDAWLGKEKDFFRATSRDMQRTEAHEAIPHAPDIFWKIVALIAIATLVLGVVAAFTIDWDKAGTIPSRDRPTTSIDARSLDQEA